MNEGGWGAVLDLSNDGTLSLVDVLGWAWIAAGGILGVAVAGAFVFAMLVWTVHLVRFVVVRVATVCVTRIQVAFLHAFLRSGVAVSSAAGTRRSRAPLAGGHGWT